MLTTIDNPYNPYTNWDEWRAYDESKGYCCCAYLARLALTSDSLTEEENDEEIYKAMLQILTFDPLKIYKLIGPNDPPNPVAIDTVGGS